MVKRSEKHQTAGSQIFYSKSFKNGLDILKDEIQLAFQWQRPSILLAVHNSILSQVKAQHALELEIIKSNKKVERVKADSKSPDVISTICHTSNRQEIVFFVSELGNVEDPLVLEIFHALNMHRELLVEQQIRVVFWLTKLEAANLPHYAPDFWAFRHRVVEFSR